MRIADREVSRATVLGFGRTGRAVMEFLLSRRVETFVSDSGALSESDQTLLKARGIPYEENGHTEAVLAQTELLVLSPGVSPKLPLVKEAHREGILVLSELDLAYQASTPPPIIAVTGTNGKSTTVKLIGVLLKRSGLRAIVAGNIGTPFIAIVDQASACDAVVVEVSSFQLEQSSAFHPQVAVLLNLTPDHLDRHKTMTAYTAAKARLFHNQTSEDTAILPSDLAGILPEVRSPRILFDRLALPPLSFIGELPPHNRANLQAAIAACSTLLPSFDPSFLRLTDLKEALCLPFRLQREGEVGGVRVINDSKSTNAASTLAALESVSSPVVLILGGRHKQEGYMPLAEEIATSSVRQTVLYGEAAAFLHEILEAVGYTQVQVCADLQEAIAAALVTSLPGDVLLFSPACSSFDQYQDYQERGEHFSRLIRSHPSFSPT